MGDHVRGRTTAWAALPGAERRGRAAGEEAGAGAEADGRDGPAAHRRQQPANRGQPEQGALRHRAHTRPVRRVTRARARARARPRGVGARAAGGATQVASACGGGGAGARPPHARRGRRRAGACLCVIVQVRAMACASVPAAAALSRAQVSGRPGRTGVAAAAQDPCLACRHMGALWALSAVHVTWLKAWVCAGASAVVGAALAWQRKFAGTGLLWPVQSSILSLPAVRGV